jgi:glycyl-tRNA synthetase
VAPIQIAILPLSKKDELITICNQINSLLSTQFRTEIDVTQSIGKRYRRQDEIGTPSCITVDFESLSDKCVTVRNRDTMEQERIEINSLVKYFKN